MRRILREHSAIALVLALFIVLGIIYSMTTPLFETPDEREHFAFVQYVATGRGLPIQSEQPAHLARQEGSQPPVYYLLAAAATWWIDTSDFPGIFWENPHYGYNVPGIVNDNKNLFIHTSLESFPYHNAVLAMRIARWLSVAMGALAVLFTYLLALEIFSRAKLLAASASAIVAFVPQFLFISGAVSNDSTIAAISACALWLMVRLLRAQFSWRAIVVVGIVVGLAALTKVSGLGLIVLATCALGWKAWQGRNEPSGLRRTLLQFFLFTFAFSLVAGWWYIRNLVLYGELTGTEMMSRIFFARPAPLALDQLLVQLGEVWETFWIGFGWGNIRANPAIYTSIAVFVLVGAIGLVKFSIADFRFSVLLKPTDGQSQIALLLLWLVIVFAAFVRWMMVTQAPHGRLMFPALPAIAILMVLGFAQFQISRVLSFVHLVFVIFLFPLAALAPFAILRPGYAYPQTLQMSEVALIPNRVDISYDDRIKLLGYEISPRRVLPGDTTELVLYWQSLAPMDEDYSIGIRVLDANQRVIGARDSYPGHGMLPTRLWRAGQIIRDVYWLPIAPDAPAVSDAQILVSLYERISKRDLIARDPRGQIITPFIGQIKVAPE